MPSNEDLYVFDLPATTLDGIELLKFDSLTSIVVPAHENTAKPAESTKSQNQQECSVCKRDFGPAVSGDVVRSHYKSDWHRLNLKRGINLLESLSEADFENLLETQSLESISGSEESSDEEDTPEDRRTRLATVFERLSTASPSIPNEESLVSHMNTKSPFILLRTPLLPPTEALGAYKVLFREKNLQSGAIVDALRHMNTEQVRAGVSVLLMIGGGHFAGAVVAHQRTKSKGNPKNQKESMEAQRVVVLHLKTFHRYTTRRKQGGSQSASDNARGKANSAGSSIRRYNEEALKKEVHELLQSWKEHIDAAEHIFIRANGVASRKILVGYDSALIASTDCRLQSFPFTTKRATLAEVKNAWVKLTHLVAVDLPKTTKPVESKSASTTTALHKTPEPVQVVESDVHTSEIIALLRKSKAPLLVNYLRKNNLNGNFRFKPEEQHTYTPTPLHFAAANGLHHMVKVLLTSIKADPTLLNGHNKTAAHLSSSGQVTNMFQVCRYTLGEDFCDWNAAHVGAPKTMEEVAKESEEAKQRLQRESARAIQEELAKKTEVEFRKPRFAPGGRLGGDKIMSSLLDTSGMTEEQKMRFMREQRARAAMARINANK